MGWGRWGGADLWASQGELNPTSRLIWAEILGRGRGGGRSEGGGGSSGQPLCSGWERRGRSSGTITHGRAASERSGVGVSVNLLKIVPVFLSRLRPPRPPRPSTTDTISRFLFPDKVTLHAEKNKTKQHEGVEAEAGYVNAPLPTLPHHSPPPPPFSSSSSAGRGEKAENKTASHCHENGG